MNAPTRITGDAGLVGNLPARVLAAAECFDGAEAEHLLDVARSMDRIHAR